MTTDTQLIDYCDRHCKTPKALFAAWRVNRMTELAGFPAGFERDLPDNGFHQMHERMQLLVDYARMRLARPAGGLEIKAGSAYQGCDGEVRHVVALHAHGRHGAVTWNCTPMSHGEYFNGKGRVDRIAQSNDSPHGYMLLPEFKDWAITEVVAQMEIKNNYGAR